SVAVGGQEQPRFAAGAEYSQLAGREQRHHFRHAQRVGEYLFLPPEAGIGRFAAVEGRTRFIWSPPFHRYNLTGREGRFRTAPRLPRALKVRYAFQGSTIAEQAAN